MHIGIVSPEFPPDIGGVESYAYEFTKELCRRGHHVTAFTRRHPEGETNLEGADIRPELQFCRRLDRRVLLELQPDIWHVMNAAYAWLAMETKPVVTSVHGNDFLKPYILTGRPALEAIPGLWRWQDSLRRLSRHLDFTATMRLVQQALPCSDHIFTNSRYTETVLLKKFPACRGRTSAAMVGVGDRFFRIIRETRENSTCFELVTISRLSEPRKNIDLVLKALSHLKEDYKFHYTVIGDGSLRPKLEKLTRALDLDGCVTFTGSVDTPTLDMNLAKADLFILVSSILPHSHEGFGIVYLEAAASGVPSLAARLAGAAEAVAEDISGVFVEQPSVDQIQSTIQKFMTGKIQLNSENCRFFARKFRWKNVVDRVLPVYRKLIIGDKEQNFIEKKTI